MQRLFLCRRPSKNGQKGSISSQNVDLVTTFPFRFRSPFAFVVMAT